VLVHRRRIGSSSGDPKGPGGTIGPLLAPLTLIGWLSIVAAIAYAAVQLSSPLEGVFTSSGDISWLALLHVVSSSVVILLPAALELGYPGVRRRNKALLIGLTLLAVAEVMRPAVTWLFDWADTMIVIDPNGTSGNVAQFDSTPWLMFARQLMGVARQVIDLAAWLSVFAGLGAAGARPRGRVVIAPALAVTAVIATYDAVTLWTFSSEGDLSMAPFALANVLAAGVGICTTAASVAVVVALLWGANLRLRPRLAWRLGAVAGVLMVVGILSALAFTLFAWRLSGEDSTGVATLLAISQILQSAGWPLLLAASLAGLGRGTDERHVPPWHAFVVRGARRLRVAGA